MPHVANRYWQGVSRTPSYFAASAGGAPLAGGCSVTMPSRISANDGGITTPIAYRPGRAEDTEREGARITALQHRRQEDLPIAGTVATDEPEAAANSTHGIDHSDDNFSISAT